MAKIAKATPNDLYTAPYKNFFYINKLTKERIEPLQLLKLIQNNFIFLF